MHGHERFTIHQEISIYPKAKRSHNGQSHGSEDIVSSSCVGIMKTTDIRVSLEGREGDDTEMGLPQAEQLEV